MKPVLIFRHLACEGPGYFTNFLDRHAIPWRLIAIDERQPVPNKIDNVSALVFMGGPMSVNDDLPWLAEELSLIRQAAAIGMPVLGHCLGGQLIAKALGAKVSANPVREIGWHEVAKADTTSPWLGDIPQNTAVFHWHGETFDLPPDAVHLFQSQWCRNQAFVHGKMLALQFHVEMTEAMVHEWTEIHKKDLLNTCASVQSRDEMVANLPFRIRQLHRVADSLYAYWLGQMAAD